MQITLSIITPAYNAVKFIEFCINNVISQHCPVAEHVIIDGGSTDGSVEVIRAYAEKYRHIAWVSEKDKGQSDAMNKGISMAKGKILGFLNADDFYEPNVFNRILNIMKTTPSPTLVVGNCNVWDSTGKFWFKSTPSKISLTNLMLGKFLDAFPMNPSAYFYHAALHQIIGLYDPEEHFGMDVDFMLRALQSAPVKYIDETWGNYRYLEGTKTFEDDKTGENPRRLKRIISRHEKRLPATKRVQIAVLRGFYQLMTELKLQQGALLKRVS